MAFPVALIPIALSTIKSLVKFRDRVDAIISTHKAGEPLPLLLPPAPPRWKPYAAPMREYFQSEPGRQLLALHNKQAVFAKVLADKDDEDSALFHERRKLYDLFFAANNIQPELKQPEEGEKIDPVTDPRRRPDGQLQLAAYLVESHRLARNPTVTRILLATADTVLEVAGANAGLFISNPRTRSVVESVLQNFAGEQDFDDQSTDRIFKRLLSATVVAALDTPGIIPDQPALKPFLAALADVRKQSADGDDFVASLITTQGFEKLISSFLGHVAEDPTFITKDALARKAITATLAEASRSVSRIADDPKALLGVLEAGLKAGAADVGGILEREVAGKPLLAAMLQNVAKTVSQSPAAFQELAKGELFVAIFKSALAAVSANPALFSDDAQVQALAGTVMTRLQRTVEENDLRRLFSSERLQALLTDGVALAAAHPEILGRGDPAALAMIGAALKGGATAAADGKMSHSELMEIAATALRAAAANGRNDVFAQTLAEVLRITGSILGDPQLTAILSPGTRKQLLVSIVQTTALNPKIWEAWAQGKHLQPLLEAVIRTLAADPTQVFGLSNLDAVIRLALVQIARRGSRLLDGSIPASQLSTLLSLALQAVDEQIGVTLDRDGALLFFERILIGYLRQPFVPKDIGAPEFQALVSAALVHLEST